MADVNLNVTESIQLKPTELVSALVKTTPTTLAEYLIANETIFPSGYDIAATPGDGITMRERSLSDNWLGLQSVNNFTVSGLLIPGSSVNFSIIIPLGIAYIAGRYLSIPATTVTCSPSTTSYLFLKVTRDANLNVTGAYYEVNTTGTPPVDATPIATAITSGAAITSTADARLLGPGGVIALTTGTAWIVPAGLTRIFVEVFGASGGGGGGGSGGTPGGSGTGGGTSSFGALTATSGGGGVGGLVTAQSGAHGAGSGATITRTGGGMAGGPGGGGVAAGLPGANGGYAAGYVAVTPAASIVIALDTAGGAGTGGGGAANGRAGSAALIVVHY